MFAEKSSKSFFLAPLGAPVEFFWAPEAPQEPLGTDFEAIFERFSAALVLSSFLKRFSNDGGANLGSRELKNQRFR